MKLFRVKDWKLVMEPEALEIQAFKVILDRDKSKQKEFAIKELLYVYFYCDIRSDFVILPVKEREEAIKKELVLPNKWKQDKSIEEAIRVYNEYSETTIQRLYKQAVKSVHDIGNYLEHTDELLAERDDRGKPVTDIGKITASVQRLPKLMADLKAAYKEVIKEQEEIEGKKKGSRTMNTYENGLQFE